ncbi:hypothetical protein H1R20_g2939, partial [Candolleomyces eurysporus]
MAPDTGLSNRQHSGVKGNKVQITYGFTANAAGTKKLPPIIIGHACCPRAFKKKTGEQLGFYYQNNAKAWMTILIYQDWILALDDYFCRQNRHILLLQDNFSAHKLPDNLTNIKVKNFEPNLTAHVQPIDQGIIRCFKAHYHGLFIRRAVDRYDKGVSPGDIYSINQFKAMRLADEAWRNIDLTTVRNCWLKAGILPDKLIHPKPTPSTGPSIPVSSLLEPTPATAAPADSLEAIEKEVEVALNQLESRGALHNSSRMSLEFLLDPPGEHEVLTETADQDIFSAVMSAQAAQELMDINGGDNTDNTPDPEPCPTNLDILQASATIKKFIKEINEPYAHKLEVLLSSLTHNLRLKNTKALKDTLITKFFTPKA